MGARSVVCFDGFTLDFQRRRLREGDREISLRAKSFGLLCLLVENAGRVVSKDELIAAVWPERVASDESIARCVSDVRLALGARGRHLIKTVPRRGYVFTAPVTSAPPAPTLFAARRSPPRGLSLVVLPFANLGGGALGRPLADAISESLAAVLAQRAAAFVVARSTAFAYRGRAIDARQIGHELGVRYIVAGSVLEAADDVRISVQLADADTDAILWAGQFDRRRADVLEMHDDITATLARLVEIELLVAECRRAEPSCPSDVMSQDLCQRGSGQLRSLSGARYRKARDWFEAAIRLDDRNILALVGLTWCHSHEVASLLSDNPAEQTQAGEAAIARALALAPQDAGLHLAKASLWPQSRSPELGMRGVERALAFDRNNAAIHAYMGWIKIFLGRAQETEAHVQDALRLSSNDPLSEFWHHTAGYADLFLGRIDDALDRFRQACELNPDADITRYWYAAALVEAGREKEAVAMREAAQRALPNFSIVRYLSRARSDNPVYLAQRERVVGALRKVGVPEETGRR